MNIVLCHPFPLVEGWKFWEEGIWSKHILCFHGNVLRKALISGYATKNRKYHFKRKLNSDSQKWNQSKLGLFESGKMALALRPLVILSDNWIQIQSCEWQLQSSVTRFLGQWHPFLTSLGTGSYMVHTHMCRQDTYRHKIINKLINI